MRNAYQEALTFAGDHPLIALALLLFVGFPLVLGWLHEGRFFGECGIVAIRFLKHEIAQWRNYLMRLKRELTNWKSDP